jgi:hypothetical protein
MKTKPLIVPQVNPQKIIHKIDSFTNKKTQYTVHLKELTCNCPDFIKRRQFFLPTDIRRLCKHIIKALFKEKNKEILPKYIMAMLFYSRDTNRGVRTDVEYFEDIINDERIALTNSKAGWYNIAAKDLKNKYDSFGYNVLENRWSYEKHPKNAKAIEKILEHPNYKNKYFAINIKTSEHNNNTNKVVIIIGILFVLFLFLIQ